MPANAAAIKKAYERVDMLGRRFGLAIAERIERRLQILDTEITSELVDELVRNWLGAAAEELLNDEERTKSPG